MIDAGRLLAVLDHTSLGEDDSPETIRALCDVALSGEGRPAAVCVHPEHVAAARRALDAGGAPEVAVASVVNFPDGGSDADRAKLETGCALAAGAGEIDFVYPWRAHLAGDHAIGPAMVARCKADCGERILKVILETGELGDAGRIRELAAAALDAGADFIKTSTGKRGGATLESARVILEWLRDRGRGGFKAAGGIRTLPQAASYLELADRIGGAGWAAPRRFRIGSSSILAAIRAASVRPAGT